MLNFPLSREYVLGPALLVVCCFMLFLCEPTASQWFTYDRILVQDGQIWRLLSGNLLHTNFNHLLLNCAGVLMLWALHGQYFRTNQYLMLMVLICIGTTTCIYFFSPQLRWYVGLSGALHGLFILGAYFDLKHGLKSGWLLIVGLIVKVGHEQIFGASQDIAELIGANVAIDAHLYGSIVGALLIGYFMLITALRNNKKAKH